MLDELTNEYVFLGKRRQAGRMNEYSTFVQDSWRVTPRLTLERRRPLGHPDAVPGGQRRHVESDVCRRLRRLGHRRERRLPCSSSRPRPAACIRSSSQYRTGDKGWKTDWNNFAPNVGVAWLPHVQSGFLRKILGDPEQATLRAGYSVNYAREGMARFTGVFGANPGSQVSVTRNSGTGLLIPPGESYPILFRERDRLGPPTFGQVPAVTCDASGACVPSYPIRARANRQDGMNLFHPDIQVAFARSYTASFQRALSRDMAVDIRYIGTRGVNQWTDENYNELNIIENGFYDEFQKAMGNLRANQAAGLGEHVCLHGRAGHVGRCRPTSRISTGRAT